MSGIPVNRLHKIGGAIIMSIMAHLSVSAQTGPASIGCDECSPRIALKTDLIHDALTVPNLGIEVGIARRFSLSAEGDLAWWGGDKSEKCLRVTGGCLEARCWFGNASRKRIMTGHHAGIYGTAYSYDICLGKTGRQSDNTSLGVGVSYGYSFPILSRLNLDLNVRIGYFETRYTRYRHQCGQLTSTGHQSRRWFGPTAIGVSLVWFPGKGSRNLPSLIN